MNKRGLKIAIAPFIAMAVSLVSCDSDVPVSSPETDIDSLLLSAEPMDGARKLAPSTIELDATDAAAVAGIYLNNNALSRSGSNKASSRSVIGKTVKNVVAINDSVGNPAIYAVNFDDGYIMVSATQKYFPILAEVEHGSFTQEVLKETGMEVVVDEMLANIALARSGKYDFKSKTYWRDYVDNGALQMHSPKTRVNDDYWAEYDRWLYSDGVRGNNVYYLHDCYEKGILSEDVYNSYVRAAQDEDLWEGTEYSWWWTAYVVERVVDDIEIHGPLLTTKWGQDMPYNISVPNYKLLGCVTVATAQLMKYFRHPTSISWDNMPNEMYVSDFAPDLTSFLATLRLKLNVDDKGGATILDAQRVLQEYGYNVTLINHNESTIIASLRKDKPVYARGEDPNKSSGHAWVIDGLDHTVRVTEYVLYRLADPYYPDFQYEEAEGYDKRQEYSTIVRYHYNWGWNGIHDGWFMDYVINPDSYVNNYTKNKMELIINGYK